MHVKALFIRHDRCCFWNSWRTMSEGNQVFESFLVIVLAIFGVFCSVIAFAEPDGLPRIAFLAWAVPAVIMTPFILWRITIRLCAEPGELRYGNFVRHNTALDATHFGLPHIALYLLKAYWPLLNLACVIAGIVSIARCDLSFSCNWMRRLHR